MNEEYNNSQNENEHVVTPASEDEQKKDQCTTCDEYIAGWKRAMADYANLKKDTEQKQKEIITYAQGKLIEQILPIIDSFRKALADRPHKESEMDRVIQWVDGVGRIENQFSSVLTAMGAVPINEEGVPFDPSKHEAMMMESREGIEPGKVLTVLEPGMLFKDKVIRPAKVTVSE